MSLEHRVRNLEERIGVVVVKVSFIFGGILDDCKHYQEKSCQRMGKNEPLSVPEGTKIKFIVVPHDPKETDPCKGCKDYERESAKGGQGNESRKKS